MEPKSQRDEIEEALARAGYQPVRFGFEMLSAEIGLGWETIYKAWLGSSSLGKAAIRQIQNFGYSPSEGANDILQPSYSAEQAKAAVDFILRHADDEQMSIFAGVLEAMRKAVSPSKKKK